MESETGGRVEELESVGTGMMAVAESDEVADSLAAACVVGAGDDSALLSVVGLGITILSEELYRITDPA